MHPPPRAPAGRAQDDEKHFPVALVTDDRFPSIASIQQMIECAGELDARFPGCEPGQITRRAPIASTQI